MDLDRCLGLLKNAQSDNEKMAALLLVAKMVRSGDIGEEGRRSVFEAVGFSFINRLLATRQLPEGCSVNPYRKIAVTMLACFCTDPELALHPQVTSKIPVFNEGVLQSSAEDTALAEDSLQCLQALSSSSSGLQQLVRWGTPEALASCFLRQGGVSKPACDLLLSILGRREVVAENMARVEPAVVVLAEEFRANQDALKFELCEVLYSVLSVAGEVLKAGELSWMRSIAAGLKEILSNKIGASQRNPALQLSALLCHLFGVEWVVSTDEKDKRPGTFFKLLVHLVGVEVQMLLSELEVSVVLRNSALLSSCFVILEQAVVYVAGLSEQLEQDKGILPLSQEDLLQLHSVLTNAFTFVIQFLQSLGQLQSQDHTLLHHPLVGAAVRVLGAWLSEESLALSEDVYKLLPFLLRLCGSSNSEQPASQVGEMDSDGVSSCLESDSCHELDLLKFLLPGLCHLTAEDKPRAILLKANLQKILSQRFQDLCSECYSTEAQSQLALCCGITMNVCVCEPAAVKEDAAFTAVGGCLARLLSEGSAIDENTSLALNTALSLLMISRRQGPDKIASHSGVVLAPVWCKILQLLLETVRSCPYLTRGANRLGAASRQWNEHSELWALAMQELTALATVWDDVRLAMAAAGHCLAAFNEILSATAGRKDSEQVETVQSIVGAVYSLLQAVLEQPNGHPTVTQN